MIHWTLQNEQTKLFLIVVCVSSEQVHSPRSKYGKQDLAGTSKTRGGTKKLCATPCNVILSLIDFFNKGIFYFGTRTTVAMSKNINF